MSEATGKTPPPGVPPEPPAPNVPAEAGGGAGDSAEGSTALRTFVGLFLVPLLVVLLCVGIFIGFGWIAYDRQDVSDYLNDLRSSWKPRRAQAAYELSKILIADPEALEEAPAARSELRRLFVESEDAEIRRYLGLVLGYTRDPEAVPVLTGALDGADPTTRIYLLWSLGAIGDPRAGPALLEALADADGGVRKTAAFALGELGDPAAVPALLPALEDAVADVRWNAALAVSRLGSDAGVPVLEQMLDRGLTSKVEGITAEQQQETMIGAIRALAAVRGREALPLLAELESGDPSLKVRQAAIEARKAIDSE